MFLEPWIETYSGKKMYFLDPKPGMIDIKDIAHSLSLQCRFSGHTKSFYSVAEHCIRIAAMLHDRQESPYIAMQGLLHDATEAYLLDIPSPIKAHLGGYTEMEDKLAEVIFLKYGLEYPYSDLVKEADVVMLKNEARVLLPSKGESWIAKYKTSYEYRGRPLGYESEFAEEKYMDWFQFLTGKIYENNAPEVA